MQKFNRSEIDVQVELESQAKQDVARVLVAGNARVAEGAQKNGVDVVAQMPECGVGQCLFGSEVVIRGIRQALPRE